MTAPEQAATERAGSERASDRPPTTAGRTPGDLLLHPVAILAMVVVIVNDRVLKPRYPSELTGKLSDFAGLVFFPLFLVAVAEGLRRLTGRHPWSLTPLAVMRSSIVVGVAFALIKTWSPAGEVYRSAIGIVLWPFDAIAAAMQRAELPPLERVALVEDRTDLVALVVLMLPPWIARKVMAHDRPGADVSPQLDDR